jgi:hypothetical protein
MKFLRDERGQVLVLTVVCMGMLLAFMALAIDVGMLFRAKRNVQIAADAAAVAGALDYKYNASTTSAQSAGQTASTANEITNGSNGATVTINVPPQYGPYAGATGFVEAIVVQPNPTFFIALVNHSATMKVGARAVAGSGAGAGCMWTLAKSGTDISLVGSGAIDAAGCDIYDDSNSSTALQLTGSGSITAKSIGIAGSYSDVGSGTLNPTPITGMAPAADPLANLGAPTIPTGTCTSNCNPSFTGSGSNTLNPGVYNSITNVGSGSLTLTPGNYIINGMISNTGSGSVTLGAGNYTITGNFTDTGSGLMTLGAGQYIVEGNLAFTGSSSVSATGVSFYTEGSTTVTGSGPMTLIAPTSGSNSGVLFFQSRSDTDGMQITGSSNLNMQGIIYAPAAALTLTGSGSMSISTDMIVDSLAVTGSPTITNTDYATVTNTGSVLGKLTLVE